MSRRPVAPNVHRAIIQMIGAFAEAGIERRGRNLGDGYDYRRMDDLVARLAPLLASYRLIILPRVLRRQEFDRQSAGKSLCCVNVHMAFDVISARDGSTLTVESCGEAWDESDKATAKANTAAFKTAMFQLFCIPTAGEESEQSGPRFNASSAYFEPPEGWTVWSEKLNDVLSACSTTSSLNEIRGHNAELLAVLQRERPDLYRTVGDAFFVRLRDLGCDQGGKRATSIEEACLD